MPCVFSLQTAYLLKNDSGRFAYEVDYQADDKHALIIDVKGTPSLLSHKIVGGKTMLDPKSRSEIPIESQRIKIMTQGAVAVSDSYIT